MMDKLPYILRNIIDFLFPYCPNGGHRQEGRLVTNVNGNRYCWHKDCISANFNDIRSSEVNSYE
jgi:hypothetical protein